MPRYTRCPYYIDENKNSISCEDCCRSYDSSDKKWAWMDMYCDSWDWMKCPYAMDRSEAYKRFEEGDTMALEHQEVDALKKEVHSLRSKLGHKDKKIERMQKKIDDLRAVNQSYTRVNQNLEKQKADIYTKWRSAESRVRAQDDKIWAEIGSLSEIYEQRMAYLIDTFTEDGYFYEEDAEEWAGDKSFAIVSERIDVNDLDKRRTGLIWKVVFQEKEEENKDGEHVNKAVSGDDRNTAQV